jgi:adenylate cyclase
VKRLGFANVVPDLDGIVRRAHLVARAGDRTVLSAPLAMALLLEDAPARLTADALHLGARQVAVDPDASFVVDYRARRRGAYPRVSPAQLLVWDDRREQGVLPAEARAALEGRIVVWGVNAQGLQDLTPTPIDPVLDGPEFQALVLDNLLHGGGRVHAPPAAAAAWLLGLCGLTGLATFGPKRKGLPHLLALAIAGATVALAYAVFAQGTVLDLFTPLLGVLLAWAGATTLKLFTEGRYNRWLEGTFSLYLAPSVIDALKQDPRLLELGGVERDVTVLFSDIAHFTTLSELLGPPQLVTLLNRYLTAHCAAVFAHGGVVDKFIGDAVMAFYGDPIAQPDHALRACRTALDVRAALPALEPVWRGMNLPHFDVRIGLNSGRAVLGNMGSAQRFSYTAMGDTVNLASRLEGANKAFGTHILLGEATYAAVHDAVLAKPLARLGVVGREEPIAVYELVALREHATPAQVQHVEAFARAQSAARAGDLPAARRALGESEALRPGDGPCAWFRAVIDRMAAGAEPSPWSGVIVLTGK